VPATLNIIIVELLNELIIKTRSSVQNGVHSLRLVLVLSTGSIQAFPRDRAGTKPITERDPFVRAHVPVFDHN
jgi:hypothetical protein